MKKIVFLLLVLINFSFHAQSSRAGGQRGIRINQNQQTRGNVKPQKFNSSNVAGIFYYDFIEVAKKIKIKDKDAKNKTSKLLSTYNSEVKNIAFLNSEKLNDLELAVNSLGTQAKTNPELRKKMRGLIQNTLRPLRDSISKKEYILNESLKDVLNEKQLKKWFKYQTKQKNKLKPKKATNKGKRTLMKTTREVSRY
jgi:hypothetical protein